MPTPGLKLIALMNLCKMIDLEACVWGEIIHVCQLFTNIHGLVRIQDPSAVILIHLKGQGVFKSLFSLNMQLRITSKYLLLSFVLTHFVHISWSTSSGC